MRVALLAFLHESNTFLAGRTTYEDVARNSLTTGEEMLRRWTGTRHEIGGMIAECGRAGVEIVGGFAALASPSATLAADCFERIAAEMLAELRACAPIDGILVALHGATVSEVFRDADGEILRRIRSEAGAAPPIIGTLDLHANVSQQMVRQSTALIAYRSNPHLDQYDRGVEAATLMCRTLAGEVRPIQKLIMPPLLIPMSCQYTTEAPSCGLYEELDTLLERPKILSASVCMGFYYADVEEMGASFLAVTDGDAEVAESAATQMAIRAWERRDEFEALLPDAASAVRQAINAERFPVVFLDVGDNVGGGSAADSTVLFAELLRQNARGGLVVLHDAAAVQDCIAAGVRRKVQLCVGGKIAPGPALTVRGRVRMIADGLFTETQVRHGGWGTMDQGVTAVVETEEDHTLVLTSLRMPPFSLEQIVSLGIHPERKRILIVKGVVAPRAAYAPVAAEIIAVNTPGATADDPSCFPYRHRRRPLYPLERDAQFGATR